ncbi:MAG: exodeoxyribonuclease VII small subunit [Candidatus Kryptoniota bacterium]
MKKKEIEKGALSFEDSLKRLEEIVQMLEDGSASLEESLKLYEEGMSLAKHCIMQLNEAKLKLKKIQKNFSGELEETDLE